MHEHTQPHLLPECHDYRFIFHSSLWYSDSYRKEFCVWKRKVVLTAISAFLLSKFLVVFFFLYPSLVIYCGYSTYHHPSNWVWERVSTAEFPTPTAILTGLKLQAIALYWVPDIWWRKPREGKRLLPLFLEHMSILNRTSLKAIIADFISVPAPFSALPL